MPRNEKKPTMSVTVVTNGPDETAGSTPRRLSSSGIRMPPSAAADVHALGALLYEALVGRPLERSNTKSPTMPAGNVTGPRTTSSTVHSRCGTSKRIENGTPE